MSTHSPAKLRKRDWKSIFQMLGPGLLFAGAAIGVSHLVQSTKAGAEYGFGLIWVVILIHIFKYPFFEYGPRYATATGDNLLQGYKKLGTWVLVVFLLVTFGTMFAVQSAITIVTAGIAVNLFGFGINITGWVVILLGVSTLILTIGHYKFLDNMMKVVILILTISTLLAVILILFKWNPATIERKQVFPTDAVGLAFLIALMGWLPAPIDLSVWHSLWTIEKDKNTNEQFDTEKALFDFNIGYWGTFGLAFCFVFLGAAVMYGTGETFSPKGGVFAGQLISLYTTSLGDWAKMIIGLAAFTTMFSTTLTVLDALPRTMAATMTLFLNKDIDVGEAALNTPPILEDRTGKSTAHKFMKIPDKYYWGWLIILIIGTIVILCLLSSSMGLMVKIATILSFLTAPFFAIANYRLVTSTHMPIDAKPGKKMRILSWLGIIFLTGFGLLYLATLAGFI